MRSLVFIWLIVSVIIIGTVAQTNNGNLDNPDLTAATTPTTLPYQGIVDVELDPYIPRSLIYYIQDHGHEEYDSGFEPNDLIESSNYMGFEFVSNTKIRFNYHLELDVNTIKSNPTAIETEQSGVADYVGENWEPFARMLDRDQYGMITGAKTNVTITPLLGHCFPHKYTNTDNDEISIYPCGVSACMKCSSMKPCLTNKDCQYATECIENTCGMIASQASTITVIGLVVTVILSALLFII